MRKSRLMLAAATVLVTLTGGLFVASRNDSADAAIGAVSWSDEFNGAAGTPVDGSKWTFDLGGGGFGNNEHQYYTNSTRNVAHDGQGNLRITAIRENNGQQCWYGACQYTSARILTKGKFTRTYGRFEARMKLPRGQGIWPAFWMLPEKIDQPNQGWPYSGEIDIMENIGKEPNTLHGTIHGPGYSGGSPVTGNTVYGEPLANAFHDYAVEWSPNLIVWFMDGREFFRADPSKLRGNQWVFDHPFFMIFNLAVGGNWPGYPDGSTQFPQTMLIDWVRYSPWTNGGNPNPNPPTGSGVMLKGTDSGRCIDIPNNDAVDGKRLQMWDCNGTAAQRWTFGPNERVTVRDGQMCMDPAGGSLADGTPIQLVRCNNNPVQQFVFSDAGDLVNRSANKCVDVAGWGKGNGSQLILWPCTGNPNQKWTKVS